jgi:hypothetical protein
MDNVHKIIKIFNDAVLDVKDQFYVGDGNE